MGKLSEEIKGTIAEIRPGIIATTSKDGEPNVSAKGSFRVLDDGHDGRGGTRTPLARVLR